MALDLVQSTMVFTKNIFGVVAATLRLHSVATRLLRATATCGAIVFSILLPMACEDSNEISENTLECDDNLSASVVSGDCDSDEVLNGVDVDDDNDGLIDIANATMLGAMRHNLEGTGYKGTAGASADTAGAPKASGDSVVCDTPTNGVYLCGYELVASMTLNGDWAPIGQDTNTGDAFAANGCQGGGFGAIFDGNGNTIAALRIRGSGSLGLFACIEGATVRNLNITGVDIAGGGGVDHIGALSGGAFGSRVEYVTVIDSDSDTDITAATGSADKVGGLIGNARRDMQIFAALTDLAVDGNMVGGVVGDMRDGGVLAASRAGGSNSGTGLNGGLVGQTLDFTILASHASVDMQRGGGFTSFMNDDTGMSPPSIANSLSTSRFITLNEGSGVAREPNRTIVAATYWDTTVDNLTSGQGATTGTLSSGRENQIETIGLSTAQLQAASAQNSAINVTGFTETDCLAAYGTYAAGTPPTCTITPIRTIYSSWHTAIDIDNADNDTTRAGSPGFVITPGLTTGTDLESICYDADNADGDSRWDTWAAGSARLIWKLDTGNSSYPCLRPLNGRGGQSCSDSGATSAPAACATAKTS